MKVSTIRFRKNVQVKPYETEELEVTTLVEEGENESQAIERTKHLVFTGLGLEYVISSGDSVCTGTTEDRDNRECTTTVSDTKPVEATETKVVKEVKEVKEEAAEVVEKKVVAKKPAKKPAKAKKSKCIVYDRENVEHRTRLAALIVKITGDVQWPKKTAIRAVAAKLSNETLIGMDFIDASGEYTEEFMSVLNTELGQ